MRLLPILMVTASTFGVTSAQARPIDHVGLSQEAASGPHTVRLMNGSVVPGGLGQPAIRISAPADGGWKGGGVNFSVKVDPVKPTFFTIRLWGGEAVEGNLTLICGGKQVGDRLLSDYDQLDYGSKHPPFPGAFFYRTSRLPDAVTKGKNIIDCTIGERPDLLLRKRLRKVSAAHEDAVARNLRRLHARRSLVGHGPPE